MHDHGHDHSIKVTFAGTDVADATALAGHPPLAALVDLNTRHADLDDEGKHALKAALMTLDDGGPWHVGFHAEGDACAVCGEPTATIFTDQLKADDDAVTVPMAAFVHSLPVHPACADGFDAKFPRPAPRVIDQAKRSLMKDLDRPSAAITQFFRHDLVNHGELDVEEWANAVADANKERLNRAQVKDLQKLIDWVHDHLHTH